jgi:hypothetical protein
VPFVARGDRPVFCSDCYNEERKRQEAAETAETEALAARAASGPTVVEVELEGAGPTGSAPGEASEEAAEEDEEPRPVVLDTEAIADSNPSPLTS